MRLKEGKEKINSVIGKKSLMIHWNFKKNYNKTKTSFLK